MRWPGCPRTAKTPNCASAWANPSRCCCPKDVLPFRDLFPTRLALRLTEARHVDMVLGDGARNRGAVCDQIPDSRPGVGYVALDGVREPVRVRAAYVTDEDIAAMAADYPTPHRHASRPVIVPSPREEPREEARV